MFKLGKDLVIGYAQLNVSDLQKMKDYYIDTIGLDMIEEREGQVALGIEKSGKTLIILNEVSTDRRSSKKAGLFHTAFLLPTRKDLGNVLYSLLKREIRIDGASDHGYSEAIYLQDPEGNGIEIYRDKPKSEWIINEDGTIPGVTEEMDAEGVLTSRDSDDVSKKLSAGTLIGHMHLSVSDLDESSSFYIEKLGLSLKYNFGAQARFIAAGDYHHHIGMNIWGGKGLSKRSTTDLGLHSFSLELPSKNEFEQLIDHLNVINYDFETNQNHLLLFDPNGIQIKLYYPENK